MQLFPGEALCSLRECREVWKNQGHFRGGENFQEVGFHTWLACPTLVQDTHLSPSPSFKKVTVLVSFHRVCQQVATVSPWPTSELLLSWLLSISLRAHHVLYVYLMLLICLYIPLPSSFLSHGGCQFSEILNVLFTLNT